MSWGWRAQRGSPGGTTFPCGVFGVQRRVWGELDPTMRDIARRIFNDEGNRGGPGRYWEASAKVPCCLCGHWHLLPGEHKPRDTALIGHDPLHRGLLVWRLSEQFHLLQTE